MTLLLPSIPPLSALLNFLLLASWPFLILATAFYRLSATAQDPLGSPYAHDHGTDGFLLLVGVFSFLITVVAVLERSGLL